MYHNGLQHPSRPRQVAPCVLLFRLWAAYRRQGVQTRKLLHAQVYLLSVHVAVRETCIHTVLFVCRLPCKCAGHNATSTSSVGTGAQFYVSLYFCIALGNYQLTLLGQHAVLSGSAQPRTMALMCALCSSIPRFASNSAWLYRSAIHLPGTKIPARAYLCCLPRILKLSLFLSSVCIVGWCSLCGLSSFRL